LIFQHASSSISRYSVSIVGTLSRLTSSMTPRSGKSGASSIVTAGIAPAAACSRSSWASVLRP
jgi:hypothetical protein